MNLEASLQSVAPVHSLKTDVDEKASAACDTNVKVAEPDMVHSIPQPRDSNMSAVSVPSSIDEATSRSCQIVWCDQRAFKETAETNAFKAQLENRAGPSVKAHKTAEKCIRLLQKKQHWREKPQAQPPRVFLVSWANAPVLVPYLTQSLSPTSKVVVLCDECRNRGLEAAHGWARQFAIVEKVAVSWEEAIEAVVQSIAALQILL